MRESLPDWPRLMNEGQAAAYLSIGATTLREKGPAPRELGRRRLYDRLDLDRWADRLGGQPRRGETKGALPQASAADNRACSSDTRTPRDTAEKAVLAALVIGRSEAAATIGRLTAENEQLRALSGGQGAKRRGRNLMREEADAVLEHFRPEWELLHTIAARTGVFSACQLASRARDLERRGLVEGKWQSSIKVWRAASDAIRQRLAEIEAQRAAMPPEERARLEAEELQAQRESWIRAMAPCEHGVADFEECQQCRAALSGKETGDE